jgi:hypothetical protein
MTEVDRRITDPHYDAPFLTWYDGIFEAVFIALHPFVKIDGIDPAAAPRPVLVVDRSTVPDERLTMDAVNKVSEEYTERFSIDLPELQRMEKKLGTPVSWEDVKVACGFDSIGQIDTALLTIIMAIKQEFGNVDDAQHLQAYCTANQIFLPTEDTIPPVLEPKVCSFLERLGCESVLIADEFNDNVVSRKRVELDIETSWAHSDPIGFRFNKLYAADHSFLVIVPWDNFYTVICGSRKALEAARVEELFDGFWCDASTRPDWWRQ